MGPTLVTIDFSGTLSPASAAFGRSEHLLSMLHETGWAQLWLAVRRTKTPTSPSLLNWFWHDVIVPTWEQGGTTPIGYQNLLCQRLAILCDTPPDQLKTCVAAFTEQYWAAAIIAPDWIPFLCRLTTRPDTILLIATDHYADATAHILSQLARHGLAAIPLLNLDILKHHTEIMVANSADIGHFKATREFWQIVITRLPPYHWNRVIVIDDFGANEASQDAYALPQQVEARQKTMLAALIAVFRCEIEIILIDNAPANMPDW